MNVSSDQLMDSTLLFILTFILIFLSVCVCVFKGT